MLRRNVLRAGAAVASGSIVGCARVGGGTRFEEDFEDGLGEWVADAAIGPEVDPAEFDWEVGVTDEQAYAGDRSLRVWNEGDHDDGVTWAVHPVPVRGGRAYEATVRARFWSESESFNTLRDAVMRLGPARPAVEEDFPQPGVNTSALGETPYGGLREPLWLADGWREYAFRWTTPELGTDLLYLALGTSVIWEGDATHYVDAVSARLEPRG